MEHTSTLIDHIYTNDVTNKITPGIIIADISDHLPVEKSPIMIRDITKFNKENFLNGLYRYDPAKI